nr:MAG TPA: type I neck protein [Caudoviricetes sp.]
MSLGNSDAGDLKRLQKRLNELTDGQGMELERFYEQCAKDIAALLLAQVIPRTPEGVYPPSSGKNGGTLRRGWTGGKEVKNIAAYANKLHVRKEGSVYVIEITNPTFYGPYVEHGHRAVNGRWVEGRMMLQEAELETQNKAPALLEKKIEQFLKRHIG